MLYAFFAAAYACHYRAASAFAPFHLAIGTYARFSCARFQVRAFVAYLMLPKSSAYAADGRLIDVRARQRRLCRRAKFTGMHAHCLIYLLARYDWRCDGFDR